jgi:hypothetical protein
MSVEPHAHEHVHDEAHAHAHEEIGRVAYAPVQFASLGVGIFLVIVSLVGLSRMGWPTSDLRARSTEVFGLGMTPLLAWGQLVIGGIAMLCAGGRELARGAMLTIGSGTAAAGIILLIKPDFLSTWFAMNTTNGAAYLVAGGVGVATVIGTPITSFRRRHVAAM